eukprot:CAMPEP_0185575342 /NCGR_PEP_ID=MMETSP0434-20130131/6563_1 /TAXON_ID=626734 ORGANISM="Favella taraikaensis, Strain Fe Narragansett Bay" /NCGR_SAMPLE_ID=MMETSP0434 /ASSEMBLY_ACC=CAM_ASM_000379 /LENGTH=142 /DNA_ID=CAMNT_0028192193 /DNA_START=592 /DNA_END=1020 /DNA_ORIENTATION=-
MESGICAKRLSQVVVSIINQSFRVHARSAPQRRSDGEDFSVDRCREPRTDLIFELEAKVASLALDERPNLLRLVAEVNREAQGEAFRAQTLRLLTSDRHDAALEHLAEATHLVVFVGGDDSLVLGGGEEDLAVEHDAVHAKH